MNDSMNRMIDYIQARLLTDEQPFCAYLYDRNALRAHVSRTVATLPEGCRLFFAIKANSDREILAALAPIVYGFEVASLGEVKKVRAVAPDKPILFGGPGKTDAEIEGAIEHRVTLLHVESLHELRRADHIAGKHGVNLQILLRVNLRGPLPSATLAMAGRPTQFGIDEELVPAAIELAQRLPHVELKGFHFHSLSNNLDAATHVRLVDYYLDRVEEWTQTYDLKLSYLNAGGGIGVNYADLEAQFDWDAFVEGLGARLEERGLNGLQVLFECGRYLPASCGYYAAQVLDLKENHGKRYAILRGGTHHFRLPVSWQHSHPFVVIPSERWEYPFERPAFSEGPVTLVGQLCTPKDVLASDVQVQGVRAGDVILFRYAGAYGWAISHHDFLSHPHAEHLYLDFEGEMES